MMLSPLTPIAFIRSAHAIGRRAGAVDDDLAVGQRAACQIDGVDQAGGGDDRGAVLVVVKDGDVEKLPQTLLDHEAFGRLDVLEIDAAKSIPEQTHALDHFIDVFGEHFDVEGIDIGEAFGKERTSLPLPGFEASGPMLPSPNTAVPLEMTATMLPRAVSS